MHPKNSFDLPTQSVIYYIIDLCVCNGSAWRNITEMHPYKYSGIVIVITCRSLWVDNKAILWGFDSSLDLYRLKKKIHLELYTSVTFDLWDALCCNFVWTLYTIMSLYLTIVCTSTLHCDMYVLLLILGYRFWSIIVV